VSTGPTSESATPRLDHTEATVKEHVVIAPVEEPSEIRISPINHIIKDTQEAGSVPRAESSAGHAIIIWRNTMNKSSKVRVTKVRQQHSATRQARSGQPYNGPNLVTQHGESSKKAARKTSRNSSTAATK